MSPALSTVLAEQSQRAVDGLLGALCANLSEPGLLFFLLPTSQGVAPGLAPSPHLPALVQHPMHQGIFLSHGWGSCLSEGVCRAAPRCPSLATASLPWACIGDCHSVPTPGLPPCVSPFPPCGSLAGGRLTQLALAADVGPCSGAAAPPRLVMRVGTSRRAWGCISI